MAKYGRFVLLFTAVTAFCLTVTCAAGDHWGFYDIKDFGLKIHQGIFQMCVDGKPKCMEYPTVDNENILKACRAVLIIACYSSVAAAALSFLSIFSIKIKGWNISIFSLCSALVLAGALSGYMLMPIEDLLPPGVKSFGMKLPNVVYGRSFTLGWVGCVFGVATTITGFFAERF